MKNRGERSPMPIRPPLVSYGPFYAFLISVVEGLRQFCQVIEEGAYFEVRVKKDDRAYPNPIYVGSLGFSQEHEVYFHSFRLSNRYMTFFDFADPYFSEKLVDVVKFCVNNAIDNPDDVG